jgi:hypothetical protein
MDKSKVLTHPYHLVDPSPWPIFMSFAESLYIVVGTGFVCFFIFVFIVFLRHIPHMGLIPIAKIWGFGNKSGIEI